ncbi:MAG: AarF/UbiB family protein [Gemmatimonadota bacterium]
MFRTIRLLRLTIPLLASFARDRRRWLVVGGATTRSAGFHAKRAAHLTSVVAQLGPTFVKLSQLFAGRRDLIPSPYVDAISTLTDQVPPIPWPAVVAALTTSYGRHPAQVFDIIDAVPLAAASLGQVHRATIAGRDVVVKVLRPGVEQMVEADLKLARMLLRQFGHHLPRVHGQGLAAVLDEFERRVADEMDFRTEARFAKAVRTNFAGVASVRVPEVIEGYTRQRALVLEYMAGTRIDRLDDAMTSGRLAPDRILGIVIELYVRMMLVDGLFHADPHPGNLLVDEQGRVVLLDFGMVVEVNPETRRALVRTVFAAISEDRRGLVEGFYAMGIVEPGAPRAVIEALADELLLTAHDRTTVQERLDRMSRLADDVVGHLYNFPVRLPSDLVYFARTAALIEGLGTRYDPRFNPVSFATPIALRFRGPILRSLGEGFVLPDTVPGAIGAIAGHAAAWTKRVGQMLGVAVRQAR